MQQQYKFICNVENSVSTTMAIANIGLSILLKLRMELPEG